MQEHQFFGCIHSLFLVVSLSATAFTQGASIRGLGGDFVLYGLSGDGSTVYGKYDGDLLRWNLAESPDFITIPGLVVPHGITYDGSTIVGSYLYRQYEKVIPPFGDFQQVFLYKAFVYSSGAQSLETLGFLDEGTTSDDTSSAIDVSRDGSVIVGSSSSADGQRGFRWTRDGGMQPIEHPSELPGKYLSSLTSVSADGNIAVGRVTSEIGSPPPASPIAMWTADSGTSLMQNLDGSYYHVLSYKDGISADGLTVIGSRRRLTFSLPQAWRWSEATGFVYLDDEAVADDLFGSGARYGSNAIDVSADGAIIVGSLTRPERTGPMIWDETNGVRFLADYFVTELGLGLNGWSLSEVIAISDDGQTFLGSGINPTGEEEYWIVTVPEPSTYFLTVFAVVGIGIWRIRNVR